MDVNVSWASELRKSEPDIFFFSWLEIWWKFDLFFPMRWIYVIGMHDKIWVAGTLQNWQNFCQMSPVSDRPGACHLQEGPATGQSWVDHWQQ